MQEKAKQIVFNYVKNHIDKTDNIKFTLDDIESLEPITMYINDKYTTIDIFN